MKEIIGDDYPTYEDSVKMTLAERKQDGMCLDENNTWRMDCGCTEANVLDGNHNVCKAEYQLKRGAVADKILLSRALHRLACIETDIKIIARHIENNCPDQFEKPSLNEDGSVFADCAWHNISNIEIACDLTDDAPLEWGTKKKFDISKEIF